MEDMKKHVSCNEDTDLEKALLEIDKTIAKVAEKLEKAENASRVGTIKLASDGMKKKLILTAVAMIFMVTTFVFSSLAYFTVTYNYGNNVIATGGANVEFVDVMYPPSSAPGDPSVSPDVVLTVLPGHTVVRNVSAKNSGDIDLYIRARVVSKITLADRYSERQDEVDVGLIEYEIDETKWIARDGYYYYSDSLGYGETTPNFLSKIIFSDAMGNIYKDSVVKINVVFEIVQANGNGANVFEANGWPSASEGGAES